MREADRQQIGERIQTADGGRQSAGEDDDAGGRPSTNRGTNKRMATADGRRQTAGGRWMVMGRAFQQGGPSTNRGTNKRIQTADGRPRGDDGRCGRQTVNEWGTNTDRGRRTADRGGRWTMREADRQRMGNEYRPRTADGRPREDGGR